MTLQLPIVQVTVHPDGAIVRRRGPVLATEGQVSISHLPLLMHEASLRVEVTGGSLVQAHLDLDLPYQNRSAELEEQTALTDIERQLGLLAYEVTHLDRLRSFTRTMQAGFDPESAAPTVALLRTWVDLDASLLPWSEQIDRRLRDLQERVAKLNDRRAQLMSALQNHSSAALWQRWAPTRSLNLEVQGDALDVEVSYAIPGARWTPAYAVDLHADFAHARFTMRALIAQATGEDWTGVALKLSTAPCRRHVDLPKLTSLRLGTQQPAPRSGWRPLPDDLDGLFPSVDLPTAKNTPAPEPMAAAELDLEGLEEVAKMEAPPLMAAFGAASASMDVAPQARSAPMPAPAQLKRKSARARKSAGRPPPPPPVSTEIEAADAQLDYANLRVHGPDTPAGKRGRLHAIPSAQRFSERTLPSTAWTRWSQALSQLVDGTHQLNNRPLPPHHVLPGPVQGNHQAYRSNGLVNIPSDSRFHAASLLSEQADIQLSYRAVPRDDARVFRRVTAAFDRFGALPPGPLEASIEGALEIVVPFKGAAGDAAISFGLGTEDGISLARNVRYEEQSAGLFGGSRTFTTSIEVQFASSLSKTVRVELLDRVPVPLKEGHPSFDVTEASPPTERWKGEEHGPILEGAQRQWVEVLPGATTTSRLCYSVTLSNKEEIEGGDRRG